MEKDFYSNTFFSDNERYADIINAFGCDGEPFIKGKDLQELDTRVYLGRQWGGRQKSRRKLIMHYHFGLCAMMQENMSGKQRRFVSIPGNIGKDYRRENIYMDFGRQAVCSQQ